jgi:hypothetical protein
MPEADDFDPEVFDAYLCAEVLLPKGDSLVTGTVVGHKRDMNGNPVGQRNSNPIWIPEFMKCNSLMDMSRSLLPM